MIANLRKYRLIYIVILIILLGTFLRVYHFSDWLHFELDQARDAKVVDLAIDQGIGNLPLLGPKAAGSFLRLGPIFYYFEYLGSKIFGNNPPAMASFNLIFSILSLPLFYLFTKRYFNKKIAITLLFVFASSLFLVMYSRFAWNPNSLPFFILATMYALLRVVDLNEEKRGKWLMISSAALAIATQLHFVAFIIVPTIAIIFLIIKRPKIKFIFWLASILIIFFFYLPPIINDIKTRGANIKEFKKAFIEKSDSSEHSLLEKAVRNYTDNAIGYFIITTSYQAAELPKIRQEGITFDIRCDWGCRKNIYSGIGALMFFTLGIALLLLKVIDNWREKENSNKDFIILVSLWLVISFIVFAPIAYDLAPRFLLIIAGLPLIMLGLILQQLEKLISNKKTFLFIFCLLIIILAWSNLSAVKNRFHKMSVAAYQSIEKTPDPILKEDNFVTLEQQSNIVAYIEAVYLKNKFPVYLNSEAFYRRSFFYHLGKKNIPYDDMRNMNNAAKIYQNGNYFLIYPTNSNLDGRIGKYTPYYDTIETTQFGTLMVFHIKPKKEAINDIQQDFNPTRKPISAPGVPVRCRWNEIFKECNPFEVIDDDSQ